MKSPSKYKVALLQTEPSKAPESNLELAARKIEEVASQGARLVCLPELFQSNYFCQTEDDQIFELAEPIPGPATETLGKVAKKTGTVVVASLFERRAAGIYHNAVAVIDADGEIAGLYRKMHIPDDPGYYEKFYFTPGDLGFRVFDTAVGKIGTLICWDQWFPEGARLTALQGANILIYPTAIGWHPKEKASHGAAQHEAWKTIQRGHAIANGIYVAAINRVGHEVTTPGSDGIEFWGQSFLCDPQGVVLAEGSSSKSEVLWSEVDIAHLESTRRNWPFFRDRRIDAYDGVQERFLDEPYV